MSHIDDQTEIINLIEKAVANAKARRNKILEGEASLSTLSDKQSTLITGGKKYEKNDPRFVGITAIPKPSDVIDRGWNE